MTPWWVLTVMVAAINLAALLVVRGRWGRIVALLLPVAVIGTAAGEAIGGATGLEVIRVGDYHLVAACVGAQVAMIAVLLVASALPEAEEREGRD
jgi:hypothetical protein